VTENI